VFAAATTLSVALGVAANTATFSVFDAVLLRPLPYATADRLAIVWNEFPGADMGRLPLSGPEVQMLREQPDLFEQVEAIWATSGTVAGVDQRVSQVSVGTVTPEFFTLLGVVPQLGRTWVRDASEGRSPSGVVLSDEAWRARFGADPAVVGSTIQLSGRPALVIGVLPPGFTLIFPEDGSIPPRLDVYIPVAWDLSVLPPAQQYLRVVGRLREGVDPARAAASALAAADRAVRTYPELQATGDRFSVHPLQEDTVRAARPALVALLGAVVLFLLLASANVASLVLARTMARGRELAIRSSLGASSARLGRLVMTETLTVTLMGAALGAWLGRVGARTLWALRPAGLSRVDSVPLDGRVLLFTAGLSVAVALAFAAISLVAVRGLDPSLGLRAGGGLTGRAGRRLREIMTGAEVAVGVVLVAGSALMIQSVTSLGRESIGFDPSDALTFKVPIDMGRFATDAERARVAREIERRVGEIPGVTAVGATSHLPFATWANWGGEAPPEGTPEAERTAYMADLRAVTPSYLPAVGASLVAGRFFEESDDGASVPVVILDKAMAARVFPGVDPVGRSMDPVRFFEGAFAPAHPVVVGVIRDVRDRSPARPSVGQVFWPFAQSARWELTFFARASGEPAALAADVESAVAAVDPDLAAAAVAPMDDYVRVATALTRFLALVATVFSGLALLMASIGLYGVIAFVTIQRTHELGMRVVLGATRSELLGGVLLHGLRVGGIGAAVGVLATLGLTRFLSSIVYGVSPRDPVTLAGVCALLIAVALAASLAPARRATRVDPLVALRDS
jgi:predicted permease